MVLKFEIPEKTKRKIKAYKEKLKSNPDVFEIFDGDDVQIYYYKDGLQFINCFIAGFTASGDCFALGRDGKSYHITKAQMQFPGLSVEDIECGLLVESFASQVHDDDLYED
ncbi:MAG: hypothetical protein WC343_02720 [Bacilli bacterium]|jgi:hypothetical protein